MADRRGHLVSGRVLEEGDLRFDFTAAVDAYHFDTGVATHRPDHWKGVDLIVEEPDRRLFIEVKDSLHPNAQPKNAARAQAAERQPAFAQCILGPKALYSYLYLHLMEAEERPTDYVVLITDLSDSELPPATSLVERAVRRPWTRRYVRHCRVVNLSAWERLLPSYPVVRHSAAP